MRITIEIDHVQGQAQVNVTPPAAPAVTAANVAGALDAGAAPNLAPTNAPDESTTAPAAAPLLAQPGDQSAGAAPNV